MFRTNTCGELRLADAGREVTLAGWVQRVRKMGGMTFVDLRDRYGITQVVFNTEHDSALNDAANHLGREFVIQIRGKWLSALPRIRSSLPATSKSSPTSSHTHNQRSSALHN